MTGCGKKVAPALRSAAPSVQAAGADDRKSVARSAAERALAEEPAGNSSAQVAARDEGESLIGQESTERPVGTAFSIVETHQPPPPADPAADAESVVVEPIHDDAASTGLAVAMVMLLLAVGAAALWAVRRTARRRTA